MEPWLLVQNLLAVPLCVVTIIDTINAWPNLWKDQLTPEKRRLLQRISLAVLLPMVVFLHECGHAAATIAFGGKVSQFHFGFLWGEVVSTGNFTDWQDLWITLAGNLVQIACGLIALLIAFVSRSPAIVAVCVYLGLWAVAGSLIVYTLLSLLSLYGDWIAIYSSPLHSAVLVIATIHALSVALIIWAVTSRPTILWFARKTNPSMIEDEQKLLSEATGKNSSDPQALMNLGWFYFRQDLPQIAKSYARSTNKIDPENPESQLLSGWIKFHADSLKGSLESFLSCSKNARATNMQKVRAYLGAGLSRTRLVEEELRGAPGRYEQWKDAITMFDCAIELDPRLGDAKFYRAELFNRAHLYNQAVRDLSDAINESFLDESLATKAAINLKKLTASQSQPQ